MGLLDLLFPPVCLACAKVLDDPGYFCTDCALGVEALPPQHCRHCAEPGEFLKEICPRCVRQKPGFSRAHAPFLHEGAIARAVHQLKYEDHPERAEPLAELLAGAAETFLSDAPRLLCAIPLHTRRFRDRKFDQAHLLTESLAKRTGKKVLRTVLARQRETMRQVDLGERERERNVAGAFIASTDARGQCILLVDDVLTTGATARAAAKALRDAGAMDVQVLTLARAASGG